MNTNTSDQKRDCNIFNDFDSLVSRYVYGSNAHYYSSMNAMKARMNSGIFYQHGNWNNPDITGHIDAMYNGSAAGHIYDKQPLNVGFF